MRRSASNARARIRGLLAAALTLTLLVGLPLALLAVGADPVPDQLPDWDEVTRSLNQPGTDPTWLIVLLIFVAWAAWAVFAASFTTELITAVRGTTAKAVNSLSPRGTARGLIAAMSLLATPIAPITALAMEPEAAASRPAWLTPDSAHAETVSRITLKPQEQSLQRYEVEQDDTLWDIADEELSDGSRYEEIFRASESTTQPDGKRLQNPDHIEPGWRLKVPVDQPRMRERSSGNKSAKAPGSQNSTASESKPSTPQDKDSMADAARIAPKTGESRSSRAKPPESTDTAASASKTARPLASPSVQTPPPPLSKTAPGPAATDAHSSGSGGHAGGTSQTPAPQAQLQSFEDNGMWGLRTASGVGALLAAGIGASLVTRRMIQRRNRRPGQLIPLLPDEDVKGELELAEIADPLSMRRVDIALRTLAQDRATTNQALPVVRQARLSEHQFELFLAEPAQLPTPWCGTNDGTVWTLDAATIQAESDGNVDVPAPYPALVTIGHTTIRGHEAHLLLDLDYVAALGVVGDETAVSEIIRALSLELATSVWADDLQVTAIGSLSELDDALKSGRVHHVSSPEPILEQIDRRCRLDSESLAAADQDLRSARASGRMPEVWSPEVLVATQHLTEEARQQLGACVSRQPRAAISTITAHDSLGDWYLDVDSEDASVAILQPLGLRVEPQRVSEDVYQAILETFTRADQSPRATGSEAAATREPSLASLPDGVESPLQDQSALFAPTEIVHTGDTSGTDDKSESGHTISKSEQVAPLVAVLGQPQIAGAHGPIEATKRSRCLEIAAYLALHPQHNAGDLDSALWPGDPAGEYRAVRNALLSRTRRWLGTDARGEYWLQYSDVGDCFVRPEVTTDWATLNQLLPDGPFSASDDTLLSAIRLIRGRPFEGVPSQRYGWAATLIQAMVPLLTDIAYELSTRLLTSGRWGDAAAVAARGLEVDELYEPLWRIRVMATSRAAGPEAALDQIRQLEHALNHYGLDMEQETLDLMADLRPPVPQATSG
jgi:hypothetical protein